MPRCPITIPPLPPAHAARTTGLDPEGVRLRAADGLDAAGRRVGPHTRARGGTRARLGSEDVDVVDEAPAAWVCVLCEQ